MSLVGHLSHAVGELTENLGDRGWLKNRFQRRVLHPLQAGVYPTYAGSTHVVEEDWDNLLILDGCRADLFEETVDRSRFDDYRRVTSLGSGSEEWTEKNFVDERFGGRSDGFGDIVYVTSNPYTSKVAGDRFHELIEVHEDHFDEDIGQVRAEPVMEAAKQANADYPNKRLIVHFMQPHAPFLVSDWLDAGPHEEWERFERGELTREEMWRAYRETLEYVIDVAWSLVEDLDGKTVITADHGNLFGEFALPFPVRLYCHPNGLRYDGLVSVPWAIVDGDRRRIVDDGIHSASVASDDAIDQRLRDLGYRT
ncbi:hypothetical protein GRX03_06085 [Halovenus sp. WSH3]|uniref:Sulfatase n=1 Tax=Halovenus carboxidivorans TaxID=2692199 RepID=A0A6B0SZQ2_9EURY|nr:hypothetical protein [Halovenus carboxidivorans]MXR51174.1 hypothetical protein [Halovenus carboxidivorans]